MKKYMMQLQRAMTVLKQTLAKNDQSAREKIIVAVIPLQDIWHDRFATDIAEAQTLESHKITEALASVDANDLIHQQKKIY